MQKIVILGSGNVATCIGKSLQQAGIDICQVYSPNVQHAGNLASVLNTKPVSHLWQLITDAHLYLICVSDAAIVPLAQALPFEPNLVAHTSGSIGIETLARFKNYGVFYPLQTFTAGRDINLSEVPFCIEANNANTLQTLNKLAMVLSNKVFEISSAQRQKLHLAAVFANNFVNHFYELAADVLHQNALPFEALKPLLTETLNKAIELGPHKAQTGPARRGDFNVVAQHCALLHTPELEKLYSFVSQSIYQKHHKSNE